VAAKLKSSPRPSSRLKHLEQAVFLSIQKTADNLMAELSEMFKPYGISATQYNVLRILRGAGAGCSSTGQVDPHAAGLACSEIARRMLTRDPDITRLLDRLEERSLIVRQRDKADRRMITTRITAQGLKLLAELDEPVLDLHQAQLGHLSEKRLIVLLKLLESVNERT